MRDMKPMSQKESIALKAIIVVRELSFLHLFSKSQFPQGDTKPQVTCEHMVGCRQEILVM